MQGIRLKANANKALFFIYSLIYLSAISIIIVLQLRHDLPTSGSLLLFVLATIYYLVLLYQINTHLNQSCVISAEYHSDGYWRLNLANKSTVLTLLSGNSILTNRFALLNFKKGRWKKFYLIMIRNKTNDEVYHQLAKWWHSDKKARK